jgi:hypothetical protein
MPLLSRFAPLAAVMLLLSGVSAAAADGCAGEIAAASRSAVITLTAADFFDPYGEEMRSFVDTGSLGAVDARVVSARPRGIVRSFTAVPARSLLSPYFGEDLKGVNLTVSLYKSKTSPIVRIRLQQECAKYLRNTFLYY